MFHSLCEARALRAGRLTALCALALFPLVGLFAAPATPAPAPAPASAVQVGVIDADKAMSEYKGYQLAKERFQEFQHDRDDMLKDLQLGLGLPSKEFEDYKQDVIQNGKLDAQHIKAQQKVAKNNMDDYQALREKAEKKETLTDAEKTRIEQLDTDLHAVSDTLRAISDAWMKDLDNESGLFINIVEGNMDKAITETIATKKYAAVLRKTVGTQDSPVRFVWGGTDVTDDVAKLLNEKYFKPTMFEAVPAPALTMPAAPQAMMPDVPSNIGAGPAPVATPATAATPAAPATAAPATATPATPATPAAH